MGPPKDHLCRLLNHQALVDSHLAAVTGHGLSAIVPDWTVPLFLYDEHAVSSVAASLQPGGLVRVRNVHAQPCRAFDCSRPGCLRLLVHGGGHQFGRGLELLSDSGSSLDDSDASRLSDALRRGLQARPFRVSMTHSELDTALTITQLCHIPLLIHRDAAERYGVCTPSLHELVEPAPFVPPRSWFQIPNSAAPHRTTIVARVAARVADVFPCTVEDMRNVLIVACEQCRSAARLSTVSQSDGYFCDCPIDSWISVQLPQHKAQTCPFAFIKLEDSTGEILIHSWGETAVRLFTHGLAQPVARWAAVIDRLACPHDSNDQCCTVTALLRHFAKLVHEPVDLCVRMSWLAQWDLGLPASVDQLDLQFELDDDSRLIRP